LILAAAFALSSCSSKPATVSASREAPPAVPEKAPAATDAIRPASEAPASPEPSAIVPEAAGFWPSPESRAREISISVLIGNESLLRSWKVQIVPATGGASGRDGQGAALRTFAGTAGDRPERLAWDGLGPDGRLAREGLYAAVLSADFSKGLPALSLKSNSFALALSPPEPALYAIPPRVEPTPDGLKEPVAFELDARAALAPIESWRLDVVGPDGRVFRTFEGAWPAAGSPAPVSWDGRGDAAAGGAAAEPGRRYSAILSVRDVYGHAAAAQESVEVAERPYAPERSSVQPWTSGFSPNGDGVMDSMDFSLGFGQRVSVRSWRLEISNAGKGVARVFRGSAPDLPASLSWDGKDSSGAPSPEGRYLATLYVDYGSSFSPAVARSPSFTLDVTPPALGLTASPGLFSPGDGGSPLSIRLEASSPLARIAEWSVEVLDPGDRVFARFAGLWPARDIHWDGVGSTGSLVDSAETYRIVARASDEFGNSSQAESRVDTDILVIKDGDRYRVDVASIVFKGYTDDYQDLPEAQATRNRLTLDRLAAKFAKFPDYRIRLVGHAVMINWDDPALGKPEQAKILVPLSRARAAAIAKALSARGLGASRMIIEGVGAADPVVPDGDLVNRWKNRRVEFYLEK
jgi:outer membrane protein OmpA-like peptidoglycan-associated protein